MIAAASPGIPHSSRVLHVRDRQSQRYFMIDSGSDISAIPPTPSQRRAPNRTFTLQAVNNTSITTYGVRSLCLDLGLRRDFNFVFVIADVPKPILGADFLHAFNLYPDVRDSALVDKVTQFSAPCRSMRSSIQHLSSLPLPSNCPFRNLLADFPELTRPTPANVAPKHSITHHIRTTGPPKACKVRRLAPFKRKIAQAEFQHMLALGIIRPSETSWSAPLHLVPKANWNDWRPCGDYRALNSVTIPDSYPIPHLQDCVSSLHGCNIFTKLDLVRAYHQIPVALDDAHRTAVKTPFGLFEFVNMPFGLRNAAQTFQRFMDIVFRGLDFVFTYIDDVLIASASPEEHLEHLRTVFKRLAEFGLVINLQKSQFGERQVEYLGHEISPEGCRPLPAKVAVIQRYPVPQTKRQLRLFLGMINFYRRFIPDCTTLAAPLTRLTSGRRKGAI